MMNQMIKYQKLFPFFLTIIYFLMVTAGYIFNQSLLKNFGITIVSRNIPIEILIIDGTLIISMIVLTYIIFLYCLYGIYYVSKFVNLIRKKLGILTSFFTKLQQKRKINEFMQKGKSLSNKQLAHTFAIAATFSITFTNDKFFPSLPSLFIDSYTEKIKNPSLSKTVCYNEKTNCIKGNMVKQLGDVIIVYDTDNKKTFTFTTRNLVSITNTEH